MKYSIDVGKRTPAGFLWSVLDRDNVPVIRGLAMQPGQARHEAFEARRKMPDLPPLERMFYDLINMEQVLGSAIMDAQEKAEDQCKKEGGRFDDFSEQEDGTEQGIVYPENAAPELDCVRTYVVDAYEALQEFFNMTGDQDG